MYRHPLLALALSLTLVACGEPSQSRRCEPAEGSGCTGEESCKVDATGRPICSRDGEVSEGGLCELPEDCAEGLGCLRLFGLPRCLRFCHTELDPVEACRESFDEASTGELGEVDDLCPGALALELDGAPVCRHLFSEHARCIAQLPDRPDIGICAFPCDPSIEQPGCPKGSRCDLAIEAEMAVCQPDSESGAREEEPCGPAQPCQTGLLCLPFGPDQRCLRPALEQRCSSTELRTLGLARDPIHGGRYSVCLRCLPIGPFQERWFRLCPEPQILSEGCSQPIHFSREEVERIIIAALKLKPGVDRFAVGVQAQLDGWRWPDGSPLDPRLWAEGQPTYGACALLDDKGRLHSAACDIDAPVLCGW